MRDTLQAGLAHVVEFVPTLLLFPVIVMTFGDRQVSRTFTTSSDKDMT